jgi:hypothetical protein
MPEMNRFPSRARAHASSLAYLRTKSSCFADIVATCALLRQLAIVFFDTDRIWSNEAARALYSQVS